MDDEKWLFDSGCFLADWNDDSFLQKKVTPEIKPQSKDLETLQRELEEIKEHIQDVRQREWQLAKLIEFHNNDFAAE